MSVSDRQMLLIKVLADGQCHSGQALGQLLGVSRAAVWKQLQSLQGLGLVVHSQAGRGYRLAQPISLLSAEIIEGFLTAGRPWLAALTCFDSIDSTNAYLLRQANTSTIGGNVILAEQQTAGRGRRGRRWITPFGGSLCLSVGWQLEQGVSALEGLSLAVGVVVVEALQSLGVTGLSLKWPNDLLLAGRKLGGILLEIGGDLSGQCHLVLGLGLNVAMSPEQGAEVDQPWAAVSEQLPDYNRNQLAACLLDAILPLLATYPTDGFHPYRERWQALHAYRNQAVLVLRGGEELVGICRDLDVTGALCVETPEGMVRLQGGEISLRRHQ